jgi:serine phosphatase RsbU (regulator of sigma subunit)
MGWFAGLYDGARRFGRRGERRRSISTRLRWSYLLSSTLPLMVVGGLLIALSFRAQQANVYNNQATLAQGIARDISNYLAAIDTQMIGLGTSVGPDVPPERLASAINELFRKNFPHLRELAIIDTSGRERLHHYLDGAERPEELHDRSGDTALQKALQGVGERSPISSAPDGTPVFTLLLPLRNGNGAISGVVHAEMSAERISQMLRFAPGTANSLVYLVDGRRQVMLADQGQELAAPVGLAGLFSAPDNVAEYLGARGEPVVGARGVINPIRWSVVIEQAAAEAFASSRRSVFILATLVALVGLLALGWALFQAQQITRPLKALGMGAASLGAGELVHRIAVRGNDEFADLAQTFNKMAEHLQQSRVEIERQNEHLRSGLALARDIQVGLLPTLPPWNMDSLAVYARSLPAYEVGGDFYTYMALPEGHAAIAIGDISGKGVGAALLMALTSSLVEAHARQSEHPAQVLASLNSVLTPRLKANRMNAAVLYAVLDPANLSLTVCNAGMIAPLLVGEGGVRTVDVGGLPIGSLPNVSYREQTVTLTPGDTLLFVSDGVVEAHNEQNELFGFDRLEDLLRNLQPATDTRHMVLAILDELQSFVGAAEQHDDITIVAVQPAYLGQRVGPLQEMELEVHAS